MTSQRQARDARLHEKIKCLIKEISCNPLPDDKTLQTFTRDCQNPNYLTPDPARVYQHYDRICEKLMIHCLEEQRKQLKILVERCTDTNILQLLLELAGSPTSLQCIQANLGLVAATNEGYQERSDEREEIYKYQQQIAEELRALTCDDPWFASDGDDSGSESWEEEEIEEEAVDNVVQEEIISEKCVIDVSAYDLTRLNLSSVSATLTNKEEPERCPSPDASHTADKFTLHTPLLLQKAYDEHLRTSVGAWFVLPKETMTEPQVIRCILNLFEGTPSKLFEKSRESSSITKDFATTEFELSSTAYRVTLLHVTPHALCSILTEFVARANELHHLRVFIEQVQAKKFPWSSTVLEGFACGLDHIVVGAQEKFNLIEQHIYGDRGKLRNITLMQFHLQSTRIMNILKLCSKFLYSFLRSTEELESTRSKIACLLTGLHELMGRHMICAFEDKEKTIEPVSRIDRWSVYSISLKLFNCSFRPYVRIMDTWLTEGILRDHHKEFFIKVEVGEDYVLDESKKHTEMWTLGSIFQHREYSCDAKAFRIVDGAIVKFLQGYSEKIFATGISVMASVELCKSKALQNRLDCVDQPIDMKWMRSMREFFAGNDDGGETAFEAEVMLAEKYQQDEVVGSRPVEVDFALDRTARFEGLKKKYLTATHEHFFQTMHIPEYRPIDMKNDVDGRLLKDFSPDILDYASIVIPVLPPGKFIEECLAVHLNMAHVKASATLASIFREQLQLMNHLGALRRLYLMEDAEILRRFRDSLFDQLNRNDPGWADSLVLNELLYSSISASLEFDWETQSIEACTMNAAVKIKPATSLVSPRDIASVESLNFGYAVPCPLHIVIDSECIVRYSKIATFLLQIKRTLSTLVQFHHGIRHFIRPDVQEESSQVHCLVLQLANMIHFMTALHSSMTNQTVNVAWPDFCARLEQAQNIHEMRSAHVKYLETIMDRCFLAPSHAKIIKYIRKMMNYCIEFVENFKLFLEKKSASSTETAEERRSIAAAINAGNQFASANRYIIIILTTLCKTGTHAQLQDVILQLNFNDFFKTS